MISNARKFYIDGAWVDPKGTAVRDVINPSTEEVICQVTMGSEADIDRAVMAARRAFNSYSQLSVKERVELIQQVAARCEARVDELAKIISTEMGSPLKFSHDVQTVRMIGNMKAAAETLQSYPFNQMMDGALISREPIGVCGLISPWNWPVAAFATKLITALAAGCTAVFKPSEYSPLSALLMAEILHEAGVPKGVFNLVNGEGPVAGAALTRHPEVDMISFTGSVRAGVLIAKASADTVKRVVQELGGKSANVILPDANLEKAVPTGLMRCFANTGQSCQAPSRMLVHRSQLEEAAAIAKRTAENIKIGDPLEAGIVMGPLASKMQFDKVQGMIAKGIEEGARLVTGGLGRPNGFNRGYFVRPTVFADVKPEMTIAREEVFGPVLSIMTYETDDEAVEIANGTVYGLAGYVQTTDVERGKRVASRLRAGRIYFNEAPILDTPAERNAPFGGYKQSGNGRQQGTFGLEEYLEIKATLNYPA